MMDVNVIVANNVMNLMRESGKKQIDLANELGVSKQTVSKMLSGSRMINIVELKKIAEWFHVRMEDLMDAHDQPREGNVVMAFMGKVNTEAAREALKTVDELADMIIFHANARENAVAMSKTWEI